MMEFSISSKGLEKWMHQNRAEYTGAFVEGTLLDNFVIACKRGFPEPNNLIEMDPENPMVKHLYCCCGDCELYGKDITGMGIHECECFEEL